MISFMSRFENESEDREEQRTCQAAAETAQGINAGALPVVACKQKITYTEEDSGYGSVGETSPCGFVVNHYAGYRAEQSDHCHY
jgi:hypothetical protein